MYALIQARGAQDARLEGLEEGGIVFKNCE